MTGFRNWLPEILFAVGITAMFAAVFIGVGGPTSALFIAGVVVMGSALFF